MPQSMHSVLGWYAPLTGRSLNAVAVDAIRSFLADEIEASKVDSILEDHRRTMARALRDLE